MWIRYDLSYRNQVKLIYILLDDQRTKISAETILDLHLVCASKKAVPKFLSVNNIVIAPANTGRDKSRRNAVTKIDQANNGILCKVIPGVRMFKIVVIKLIAPNIEEAPAICKLSIAKSIAGPGCPVFEDKGG